MSDTLITIIGIFLAAILMFIFPLMAVGIQNDEIAQTAVQTLVSEFVNKVASQGKMTQADYDTFIQQLNATGNTYEVVLEAQILDENPGKKVTAADSKVLGENIYYSVYTSSILSQVNSSGSYKLKKGDYFIVSAENTNITIGTQLKNFFYKIVGKDVSTIEASASALIINTGN